MVSWTKTTIHEDKQRQKAERQEGGGLGQGRKPVRFIEEGVKTQYAGVFNIGFGPEADVEDARVLRFHAFLDKPDRL